MSVSFEVLGARAEPYAAQPTLMLKLCITESTLEPVHAMALRCQVMIEPQRRSYTAPEEERLLDLFGETPRWGDTLKPFLWTIVGSTVTGFTGVTEVELPIVCSYDFEVAAAKYLHGLEQGEIPLLLLFSGTVFGKGSAGFTASPVAWHEEAHFRLPVPVWREVMDLYFPNSGWLRIPRETFDALLRFKATRALRSWEDAIEMLLKEAGES